MKRRGFIAGALALVAAPRVRASAPKRHTCYIPGHGSYENLEAAFAAHGRRFSGLKVYCEPGDSLLLGPGDVVLGCWFMSSLEVHCT